MTRIIKIDRLEIKLKGCPKQTAYQVVNGLGRKLRDRLMKIDFSIAGADRFAIGKIKADSLPRGDRAVCANIQDAVASRVSNVIEASVKGTRRTKSL